jgi:hypothetical protein
MRRALNASTKRPGVVDAARGIDQVSGFLDSSGEIEVCYLGVSPGKFRGLLDLSHRVDTQCEPTNEPPGKDKAWGRI